MNLESKVRGCLLGLAVGDAIGSRVEMRTADQIAELGGISGHGPYAGRFKGAGRGAGLWTDDTAMSLDVARSLVERRLVDPEDVAQRHVATFLRFAGAGYGRSTREALERIKRGVPWREAGQEAGPNTGLGNGIPMRLAPLGCWFAVNRPTLRDVGAAQELARAARDLGMITHRHARAQIAGLLQAYLVQRAVLTDRLDPDAILAELGRWARVHEAAWCDDPASPDSIGSRLEQVRLIRANGGRLSEVLALGVGCVVHESWPTSVGIALARVQSPCGGAGDLTAGILDAVNAGGDTDTNASMVGAILGALYGEEAIPADWLEGLQEATEIRDLASMLAVPVDESSWTGQRCSVCRRPQFRTSCGWTCPDGHGGADPLEDVAR